MNSLLKRSISITTASLMLSAGSVAFASTIPASNQNLQPGQAGYVGALNNRPSNAAPPSTSTGLNASITPDTVGYWWQYEPSTIPVLVRPNNDPSANGTVTTYNFGYYLDNVLPNEWEGAWPAQALEAGAVSVRSYGWYYDNYPKYPNVGAAVDNTTNCQVFKPGTAQTTTNTAISTTRGYALSYGIAEQAGFFKAGSYGTGRDSSSYSWYNNNYQNGDDYWANQGENYIWMLNYYYPGTTIEEGSGS